MALPTHEIEQLSYEKLTAAVAKAGGQRAFSKKHNIPRSTLQNMISRAHREQFKHRPAPKARVEVVSRGVRRFILTSAQDSSKVHEGFLDNLEAYQAWLQNEGPCDLLIAGFTYNKSLFEDHDKSRAFFAERVRQYLGNERVRLGDRIDWCAEMNTLPTAVTPLTGFETYTRSRWGIFPHAKVQLKSVPTMKHEPAKIIMTTGSVTLPNYVQKRAGIKASFHHVIGAVLVEIAADGTFFARHLIAEKDGSFYDLDRRVELGGVTTGHRAAAINWGDLHVAQIDPVVARASFGLSPVGEGANRPWATSGDPTILDTLRPEFQFFHDVADFQARNHHNLRDPHHMFNLFHHGVDSVEDELREVAMFITETRRDWCQTVVVESNHDLALKKWLKTPDLYAYDPPNARFFLQCQLALYEAIERGDRGFSIFEDVMRNAFSPWNCEGVRFLRVDESFRVGDIEKGMHGHLGANGARGSLQAYSRMGPKATIGHGHGAGILDGTMMAGVNAKLDLGYNEGLSSWSHSDVVTYQNHQRAIITLQNGKWCL